MIVKLLGRKSKEHASERATAQSGTMREVNTLYGVCRSLKMRLDEVEHRLELAERKLRSEASYASKAKHNHELHPELGKEIRRSIELGRSVK